MANFFRRGTLLIPSGPPSDPDRKHLHIICTDPDAHGSQVLVSARSWYDGCDTTCVLRFGDHDWLWKDKSFIDYGFASIKMHSLLIQRVQDRTFSTSWDMNGQAFLKICRGIERSPYTPQPVLRHYHQFCAAQALARDASNAKTSRKRRSYQEIG